MSIARPNVVGQQLKRAIRNAPIGLLKKPTVEPRSLLAQFDWSADYGAGSAVPDVVVNVGIAVGGAQLPIDQVRSVKIDNTGNSCPVYVQFPDSTDTIVAAPNTIVWEPVVSNAPYAYVILKGATTGGVGSTNVYFCNVVVPPYVNAEVNQAVALYKGSTRIQRTNSTLPGFGPPALGDQTVSQSVLSNALNPPPQGANILPGATGFNYLTAIDLWLPAFILTYNVAPAFNLVSTTIRIRDPSTNEDIARRDVFAQVGAASQAISNVSLIRISGMNLRLDAIHGLDLVIDNLTAPPGAAPDAFTIAAQLFMAYTNNPN